MTLIAAMRFHFSRHTPRTWLSLLTGILHCVCLCKQTVYLSNGDVRCRLIWYCTPVQPKLPLPSNTSNYYPMPQYWYQSCLSWRRQVKRWIIFLDWQLKLEILLMRVNILHHWIICFVTHWMCICGNRRLHILTVCWPTGRCLCKD